MSTTVPKPKLIQFLDFNFSETLFSLSKSNKYDGVRINIRKNDGEQVYLQFPEMFSFGVRKSKFGNYSLQISLGEKVPTEQEQKLIKKMDEFVEFMCGQLDVFNSKLKKPFAVGDLDSIKKKLANSIVFRPTGNGNEPLSPSITPKIYLSDEGDYRSKTLFVEQTDSGAVVKNPLCYLSTEENKTYLHVKPTIHLDAIYIKHGQSASISWSVLFSDVRKTRPKVTECNEAFLMENFGVSRSMLENIEW